MVKPIIINSTKILVLVFLIFSLSSLVKYSQKLKKEQETKNKEEADIGNLLGSVLNPKEEIVRIERKNFELRSKLVSSKGLPRIIQFLINKSVPLQIEVISIKPTRDIEPQSDLPQGVSKNYIEMIMKCPYKILGQYLEDLREVPMYLTVDSIKMTRDSAQDNKLFITLIFVTYDINWEEVSGG